MLLTRRYALLGLLAAPAVIRTAGLLMPVRPPPLAINKLPPFVVSDYDMNRDVALVQVQTTDGMREFWLTARALKEGGDGKHITLGHLPAGTTVTGYMISGLDCPATIEVGTV